MGGRISKLIHLLLIISFLIVILASNISAQPASSSLDGITYKRVMVKYREPPNIASNYSLVAQIHVDNLMIDVLNLSEQNLSMLASDKNIIAWEEDIKIHSLADYTPYGIVNVNAVYAHQHNVTGKGVKVALADSGIDYNNPDLSTSYIGGYDFVNNDSDPLDDYGHGTAVAGTLAAALDGYGIVGVSPDVDLYSLKVLDNSGQGYVSALIDAIDWAEANNIKIFSMSLGSESGSTFLEEKLDEAYSNGMLFLAASGNEAGPPIFFPAKYDSVIAVGAVDQSSAIAAFSSIGNEQELVAPGVDITTTGLNNEFWLVSGTSMSAPHAAGVAALYWSADSSLSNEEIRNKLISTANDLGKSGLDTSYGYGLVSFIDICSPDIKIFNTSCAKTDTYLRYYIDQNNCSSSLPVNETLFCDYCIPNWKCSNYSSCSQNLKTCNKANDSNNCYSVTGLNSDKYSGNFSEFPKIHCTSNNSNSSNQSNSEIIIYSPEEKVYSGRKTSVNIAYNFADISVFIDGKPIKNMAKCKSCNIFNATISLKSGKHNLTVANENKSIYITRFFTVEINPPKIYDILPDKGYFPGKVSFNVDFDTDTRYYKEVLLFLSNLQPLSPPSTKFTINKSKECVDLGRRIRCTKDITFSQIEDQVSFFFSVTGELLQSNSSIEKINVDTIKPNIMIYSPKSFEQDEKVIPKSVLFNISISEQVDTLTLYENNKSKRLCSRCSYFAKKITFKQGDHNFIIEAKDFAGNMDYSSFLIVVE